MSKRLMREGLSHTRPGMKGADLFQMVDSTGGWPVGYQYLGFEHTDERKAGFCNSPQNAGWWTVVASADDYYTFKLSEDGLRRISNAAVESYISATSQLRPIAAKLQIKSSRGYSMDLSHLAQASA